MTVTENYFDTHELEAVQHTLLISFDPANPILSAVNHPIYFDHTSKLFLVPNFPEPGTHYETEELAPSGTAYELEISEDETFENVKKDPRQFMFYRF